MHKGCGGHVKDLWNCHGSSADLLRNATDRFMDEKMAPRIGLMTVFLICKPFLCQSVADPSMFLRIFFAVEASRMGIRTIRTVTEELRMRYGRAMDINYRYDLQRL